LSKGDCLAAAGRLPGDSLATLISLQKVFPKQFNLLPLIFMISKKFWLYRQFDDISPLL
jgi:hypothetical protein